MRKAQLTLLEEKLEIQALTDRNTVCLVVQGQLINQPRDWFKNLNCL